MPLKPYDSAVLNNLLSAYEKASDTNPVIKALEDRLAVFATSLKTGEKINWLEWIASENLGLLAYSQKQGVVGHIQAAHELLRAQLVEYDTKSGGIFSQLFPNSQYAQDVYLRYMYSFHDTWWLLKHIHPECGLTTLNRHYLHDPFFQHILGTSNNWPTATANSADDSIFFKTIAHSFKKNGPFPRIVSVMPDVATLIQIVIAGEINLLSPECFTESQSAGHVYLIFNGEINWLEQYNKHHVAVFDLPLECLIFLLPSQAAKDQLWHTLNLASAAGLLTPKKVAHLMTRHVFMAEEYYNKFLAQERAASPEHEADPRCAQEVISTASVMTILQNKLEAFTELHPPCPRRGSFFTTPPLLPAVAKNTVPLLR
jgi:hypothetical protein